MNFFGLLVGLVTFCVIGLGFPLVIRGERRFGYLWWPYMMGIGLLFVVLSLFIRTDWICVLVAIVGATFIWGSTELKEQAVRAELGWYPFNADKVRPPFEKIIRRWKAPHL